jgi:hypothetical protein
MMALNFQQVFDKIKQIGLGAHARQESLQTLRAEALSLLKSWADNNEQLRSKLERAVQVDSNLRCAIPLEDRLDATIPPPFQAADERQDLVTLLAADGSQVLPDRHAALQYLLVNVGAIAFQPGSGQSPDIYTESNLLFEDELYTETGMVSGEAIEQRRDIAERRMLLELAPQYPAPLLALTDGPVELWGAKNGAEEDYRKNLEIHKSILTRLQAKGVAVAGYVDKPGANLLVRTLEIARLSSEDDFKNIRRLHPLRGVSDRWLFCFLPAGSRSSVFGLQSRSRLHYTGDLALHFFYLNVGDPKHPSLVRVEFPKWVAENPEKLALLHTSLLKQCKLMGARPYPYILHRAHEIAVVKFEEKRQVEQLLELELRRAGVEIEAGSNKQSAKDLPRRGKK